MALRPCRGGFRDPLAEMNLMFEEMFTNLMRRQSDGQQHPGEWAPAVQPRIDYNYLSTEFDLQRMCEVVRTTVRILRSQTFKPYFKSLSGLVKIGAGSELVTGTASVSGSEEDER